MLNYQRVVFVPSTRIPKDIMKLAGQTTEAEVPAHGKDEAGLNPIGGL